MPKMGVLRDEGTTLHLDVREGLDEAELLEIPNVLNSVTTIEMSCEYLSETDEEQLVSIFSCIAAAGLKITDLRIVDSMIMLASPGEFWSDDIGQKVWSNLIKVINTGLFPTLCNVHLSSMHLGERSGLELIEMFTALPRELKALNLSHNSIGEVLNKRGGERPRGPVKAFQSLPRSLTDLDLGNTSLGIVDVDTLTAVFTDLPRTLKTLNLQDNQLDRLTASQLQTVLGALPKDLESLNLSGQELTLLTADEADGGVNKLKMIFEALPSSLKTLNLSTAVFGGGDPEGVRNLPWVADEDADQAPPPQRSRLDVGAILEALQTLPAGLETLILSNNNLNALPLGAVFQSLSRTLSTLDLSSNRLGFVGQETLVGAFAELPKLRTLNLERNNLNILGYVGLVNVFRKLPDSLTTLDLRENSLSELCPRDLAGVLMAIPETVATLHLEGNGLETWRVAELQEVFRCLPKTVGYVTLNLPVEKIEKMEHPIGWFAKAERLLTSEGLSGREEALELLKKIPEESPLYPKAAQLIYMHSYAIYGEEMLAAQKSQEQNAHASAKATWAAARGAPPPSLAAGEAVLNTRVLQELRMDTAKYAEAAGQIDDLLRMIILSARGTVSVNTQTDVSKLGDDQKSAIVSEWIQHGKSSSINAILGLNYGTADAPVSRTGRGGPSSDGATASAPVEEFSGVDWSHQF